MPLRAKINGKDRIASFVDDEEWRQLKEAVQAKKSSVILPCCNNNGFLRVSKLGTKHFVHKPNSKCNSKPESIHLLKIKSEIALACKDSGYEISTEVKGNNWYADVLAIRNIVKISFEVLLKSQSLEKTLELQNSYKRDGIRGCWFFKKTPHGYSEETHELPLFQLLLNDDHNYQVFLNWNEWDSDRKSFSLYDFVKLLLTRKIKFCQKIRAKTKQNIRIVFFKMECWKCHRISHVYYIKDNYRSICDLEIDQQNEMWGSEKFIFRPEILKAVNTFLKTERGKHLKVGRIKPRYSKTVNQKYLSFGCYYCDAIFGDWFVMETQLEEVYQEDKAPAIFDTVVEIKEQILLKHNHWCYSKEGKFCE